MTRLKIHALLLDVQTDRGPAGRLLRFGDGLNLLRADNTSGKSTALQSIIYALGLEGMLSPSRRIPLPHAMTDALTIDGVDANVVSSRIVMEISNASGDIVSVERSVKSSERDARLVTVHEGAALTGEAAGVSRDYFVRNPGSAQHEAGFHTYLAEFLDLELPTVAKLDGSESPLYLETVFPYYYVEQKHGWSSLQARIPTYFQIRDVGKRTAEYVLGLRAFDQVLRQQRISSNLAELEAKWQASASALEATARTAKFVIQNPPARISQGFEPGTAIPVVSVDDRWVPLAEASGVLAAQLASLEASAVRTVGDAAPMIQVELQESESALQQTVATASGLWNERAELADRLEQVRARLAALDEDLQRHKDSRTLQNFGSHHAQHLLADHICPTCHQELNDGADISAHAMTVAQNIAFIERQIAVFRASASDSERVLRAMDVRLEALTSRATDLRRTIRAARDALAGSNNAPSIPEVRARLQVSDRLEMVRTNIDGVEEIRTELRETADSWRAQRALLDEARREGTPEEDTVKLARVESLLRAQLERYGFRSLDPGAVDLNRETYRPINDGFDLGFDLSASDMIRVIWSYLFAFLTVGLNEGRHLGLLIFDEPRQQETARESYQALLAHAAAESLNGAQIIFATSEESASLNRMLEGTSFTLIDVPSSEKLLGRR